MRTILNPEGRIPLEFIIELGLIRRRNECALCSRKMDIKIYNIQLCKSCRLKTLEKIAGSK